MKRRSLASPVFGSLLWIALAFLPVAVAGQAAAQQTQEARTKRKPARPLPAQMSGILLREDRVQLEHPEEIIDRMNLRDGDLVADIGCGPGWYSLRLAERVAPSGVVFGVDIQQGMLDQLQTRMAEAGVKNVYPVLGGEDNPNLPAGKMDWVLLVDAYHEFAQHEAMLAGILDALAPGGRVALLEYRAEQDPSTIPVPIPRDHKMTIEEVMSEWEPAGFELVERLEFLPAQHYFIFKKAGDSTVRAASWHEGTKVAPLELGQLRNSSSFGEFVYFGGQPAESDFKMLADRGVKVVINLRRPAEMEQVGFDEKAVAEAAGMTYVHVPVGGDPLSDDDLQKVSDILDRANEAPVLLHCASSNRVGYVWSMFRAGTHGLSADRALAEGEAAGMRAAALKERASAFIAENAER